MSNMLYNPHMKFTIIATDEYLNWFTNQTLKAQIQIRKRLSMIQNDGYFGLNKDLEDGVWELKWTDGKRIYYSFVPEMKVLLLLGGNKNGQNKDIKEAKRIKEEKTYDKT
jgi:putative addiction module killer protein